MLRFLVGTTGGGKTLTAAEYMVDDLRNGRTVRTNCPVHSKKLIARAEKKGLLAPAAGRVVLLGPEAVKRLYETTEVGDSIYIDEVINLFNARNWSTRGRAKSYRSVIGYEYRFPLSYGLDIEIDDSLCENIYLRSGADEVRGKLITVTSTVDPCEAIYDEVRAVYGPGVVIHWLGNYGKHRDYERILADSVKGVSEPEGDDCIDIQVNEVEEPTIAEKLTDWVRQHRHSDLDITLISQAFKDVDAQFRATGGEIHTVYNSIHQPIRKVWLPWRYRIRFHRIDVTDVNTGAMRSQRFIWPSQELYDCYDSFSGSLVTTGAGGAERKSSDEIAPLWPWFVDGFRQC